MKEKNGRFASGLPRTDDTDHRKCLRCSYQRSFLFKYNEWVLMLSGNEQKQEKRRNRKKKEEGPGKRVKVSQMLGPRPPSTAAPST